MGSLGRQERLLQQARLFGVGVGAGVGAVAAGAALVLLAQVQQQERGGDVGRHQVQVVQQERQDLGHVAEGVVGARRPAAAAALRACAPQIILILSFRTSIKQLWNGDELNPSFPFTVSHWLTQNSFSIEFVGWNGVGRGIWEPTLGCLAESSSDYCHYRLPEKQEQQRSLQRHSQRRVRLTPTSVTVRPAPAAAYASMRSWWWPSGSNTTATPNRISRSSRACSTARPRTTYTAVSGSRQRSSSWKAQ